MAAMARYRGNYGFLTSSTYYLYHLEPRAMNNQSFKIISVLFIGYLIAILLIKASLSTIVTLDLYAIAPCIAFAVLCLFTIKPTTNNIKQADKIDEA